MLANKIWRRKYRTAPSRKSSSSILPGDDEETARKRRLTTLNSQKVADRTKQTNCTLLVKRELKNNGTTTTSVTHPPHTAVEIIKQLSIVKRRQKFDSTRENIKMGYSKSRRGLGSSNHIFVRHRRSSESRAHDRKSERRLFASSSFTRKQANKSKLFAQASA